MLLILMAVCLFISGCFAQTPPSGERIILEELLTVPLPTKTDSRKAARVSSLLARHVSGDKDLSYQTSWSNGSRTLTVVKVRNFRFNRDVKEQVESTNAQVPDEVFTSDSESFEEKRLGKLEIKKRRVFVPDGRKRIDTTTAQNTPFSAIALVSCGDSCTWSCTGTLISSRHVLTAAHCVYKAVVSSLRVGFLQYNGFPTWYSVNRMYIPTGWLGKKKLKYDYAVLKLTSLTVGRSHLNVAPLALSRISRLYLAGFPSDKPRNTLWQSSCLPNAVVSKSGIILYQCDANSGNSGSGVLVKSRRAGAAATYLVTAVHAGSMKIRKRYSRRRVVYNVACKLNSATVKQLKRWTRN